MQGRLRAMAGYVVHRLQGETFDVSRLKALPPGSFYMEPPNRTHFAERRDEAVVVQMTGGGPSSTRHVNPASDPRRRAGD